jgi:hypothetical protein
MDGLPVVAPARFTTALAVIAGLTAGGTTIALAGSSPVPATTGNSPPAALEVAHLPPLLRVTGQPARLVFDPFCVVPDAPDEAADRPCRVSGSVIVRRGDGATVRLQLTRSAGDELVADVPASVSADPRGFTYYAELQADPDGPSATVPAGGSAAPYSSRPLTNPVTVRLGRHAFGAARAGVRIAWAPWGSGEGEAGLEPGRASTPIGASAFDVDAAGDVRLLDEVHHRVLSWRRSARRPDAVPVSVTGAIADLATERDGSFYVLETVGVRGRKPLVRHFDDGGRELEAIETAERTSAKLGIGPDGPVVLQQPSNQWMPLIPGGVPASGREQQARGRVGRPLRGGGEVVVFREGREVRVALENAGGVRQSWRISSDSDLGEVQLAEPIGNRLVLVVRVYEEQRDEFMVLVLGPNGVVRELSVAAVDWAESAPLSRFKLVGSSVYRLGSTPAGAFVERFDLGVK